MPISRQDVSTMLSEYLWIKNKYIQLKRKYNDISVMIGGGLLDKRRGEKEFNAIKKIYDSSVVNGAEISINEIEMSILVPDLYPFGDGRLIFNYKGKKYSRGYTPRDRIIRFIDDIIKGNLHDFEELGADVHDEAETLNQDGVEKISAANNVSFDIGVIINNKILRESIKYDIKGKTMRDLIGEVNNLFDLSAYDIYYIKDSGLKTLYSYRDGSDGLNRLDSVIDPKYVNSQEPLLIRVTIGKKIDEIELIQIMKRTVTLNISPKKIVSTTDSGQAPSIVSFNLMKYNAKSEDILKQVFNMDGIKYAMRPGSEFTAIFYNEEYLRKFMGKIKIHVPEYSRVENAEDDILTRLLNPVTEEPYVSIMHVLFGDYAGVSYHNTKDIRDDVKQSYDEYISEFQ